MALTMIRTPQQRKQRRILNTIKNVEFLPKVGVTEDVTNNDINTIWVEHEQEYVPNFKLVWSADKEHYRVYIHIAKTEHGKLNAGYCICTIPNGIVATGFVMFYSFLHKHRANNKSEAN